MVKIEAPEISNLVTQVVPELRRALFELDRKGATARTVRRGFAALRNFASAFKINVAGIDIEVILDDRGLADSGDLGLDLKDLLAAAPSCRRQCCANSPPTRGQRIKCSADNAMSKHSANAGTIRRQVPVAPR